VKPDLESQTAVMLCMGRVLADGASPCDLLHELPFRRIDVEGTIRALSFAFSSGDVGDAFVRALDRAELAPSGFAPSDFAEDVFLRELLGRCLRVRVAGHDRQLSGAQLYRLISEPPREIAHTLFRQEILRELSEQPGLRKQLEKLHGFLTQFRDLLSRQGGTITSGTELRLGVLRSLRRVVELLCSAFAECRSGLQRLDQYGREIAALPSYRRVCELLDYEAHRGEVDIRIRLGFDGHVRGFEALKRRANRSNPFYSTVFGRWFTRLGMVLRGERSCRRKKM
jgi:DNA mismatch repair protein MutS2